eukprot:265789-Heterocapsa_arctica.AAC.1
MSACFGELALGRPFARSPAAMRPLALSNSLRAARLPRPSDPARRGTTPLPTRRAMRSESTWLA